MKNFRKLFSGLLFFGACAALFSGSAMAGQTGKFYTKSNIWYEKPSKILSTNYHKGVMIPIGTEAEVIKSSRKAIQFRIGGQVYKIQLVKKFTTLSEAEFFDRYFSRDNVLNSSEFTSLTSEEQKAVKEGKIVSGMTKSAVLLSYGYPPTHRTPTTENDTWTYWDSRLQNFLLQFKDGKVITGRH